MATSQFEGESGYILKDDLYQHVNQAWGEVYWATGNGWMTYGLMRVVCPPCSRYISDADESAGSRSKGRRPRRVQMEDRDPFGRCGQSLHGFVQRDQRHIRVTSTQQHEGHQRDQM